MANKTPELKILFIGLDGVGKTTIITKLKDLKDGEVVEIFPTPFINCKRVKYENKDINCIEVSGLRRYRKIWKNFYDEVDGIMFVIDSSDLSRMKIVKELIQEMDKDINKMMPVVFLVNKQDLENCLSVDQVKNFIELDRFDTNFVWKLVRTISYTGLGIKEGIDFITSELIQG